MRRAAARLTRALNPSQATCGTTLDTCTRASATSTRQSAPPNAAHYLSQQLGSSNKLPLPRAVPRLDTRTSSVAVLLCGVSFATAAYASAQAYGYARQPDPSVALEHNVQCQYMRTLYMYFFHIFHMCVHRHASPADGFTTTLTSGSGQTCTAHALAFWVRLWTCTPRR